MTHAQDAEFFSLSSSLSSSLLPSFILSLLSLSLPSSLPSLPSFLPPFLFILSAFRCLIITREVAGSHVKTWGVSPWGSLSSGPPFPCKPSRGWLLFTPADEHSIVSSFPLFPLTPSSPALTGCDHSVSTCCLHWLFFFFVFIAAQAYPQFQREGGGTSAAVHGLLTVVASLTPDMVLVAPRHVGSSWIRDQTCVSCFGRQILYHWATREALFTF